VGDDADVLRFRPRGLFEEDVDADDDEYEYRLCEPYDDFDRYRGHGRPGRSGSAELTRVVLIADQVVDVLRRPVAGSGYECAALELRDAGPPPRSSQPPARLPEPPAHEQQLAWLARIVGGDEALTALGVEPLDPEELSLRSIRADLHDRVRGIDDRLERWAPVLLGEEGLAASRRLLARAVASEPALLTRSDRDDVATGAVLWAVAKGNDLVGSNRPVRVGVIQDVCGLTTSPSGRGSAFAHAVGGDGSTSYGRPLWMFHAQPAVIPLGSPDLLVARFRRRLVLLRDLALQLRARTAAS
jgi:hypothetical protein